MGWWSRLLRRRAAPPARALPAAAPRPTPALEPTPAPEPAPETAPAPEDGGEISPGRLDQALKRLRDEIPVRDDEPQA